ncbi:uncharacterized protein F5891DRAFT_374260 [Suillus fuscotomentosus]|uniref:Fungal-type protein kinase domain-containing protein n=1 Tax=Suillus fuscotomentosus TaxID=1912939 RepID=A0AAD4EJR6_9AGAM|nr:uncharacterized protein F5891DRAFT_374260 [Suillus fuscotomentosus]KAG1907493.1 hypothetical protein F5891DRAFT_374260 [Suillus fuscotomentosus]
MNSTIPRPPSEKRLAFQNPPRAVVCSTSSTPSRRYMAKTFSTCGFKATSLWKAEVYYRDVSPGDMRQMTWVLGATNTRVRCGRRAPPPPSMALELLNQEGQRGEAEHLYGCDMELFVWCFAWICLRYEAGVILPAKLCPFNG